MRWRLCGWAAGLLGVACVAAVASSGVAACAGSTSEPRPVPSLASTPQAAAAFDEIRANWSDPDANPAVLRRLLERFISRFPTDGLVPLARVYLALVAMQQGDLAMGDTQLAASQSLPPGIARDLWTVARARRLRLRGDFEAALT
ncbi:MAG TPA: hypothetical protein VE987_07565, partial [Polyangiaceae bacterium]|nr:hypothetical protein [Polyangiaceae bacterium]